MSQGKHDFVEQGVAGISERLHLVSHMLCILSRVKIALHRDILSVTSERLFTILLKVMYIICKKDFLPVMPINTVMEVQERHPGFWYYP